MLLLLIHPPHRQAERRCTSGGRRGAPCGAAAYIERRCSEANRRRCPRMDTVAKGPRALARGRTPGAKTFGYFGAFAKVTRRKGGTISRHNRSNGYTPNPRSKDHNLQQLPQTLNTIESPTVDLASTKDWWKRACTRWGRLGLTKSPPCRHSNAAAGPKNS